MQLRTILVAATFAAAVEASVPSELLAQATPQPGVQPAPAAIEGKIDHKPLERTPRGAPIVIRAQVKDPARLFAPLVFARTAGSQRFGAYTMADRGNRGFVVRLPSAILEEGSRLWRTVMPDQRQFVGSAGRAGVVDDQAPTVV